MAPIEPSSIGPQPSDSPIAAISDTVPIRVEFTGGLELFFSNKKQHVLAIHCTDDKGHPATLGFLIQYLLKNCMTDRRTAMFVLDGAIRPGILVLVNDADWELEGGEHYELRPKDNIIFVSTLHGG